MPDIIDQAERFEIQNITRKEVYTQRKLFHRGHKDEQPRDALSATQNHLFNQETDTEAWQAGSRSKPFSLLSSHLSSPVFTRA